MEWWSAETVRCLGIALFKISPIWRPSSCAIRRVGFPSGSAQCQKQANSTKTGLALEVVLRKCTSDALQSSAGGSGRVFILRVGYNREIYVACHSFLNLLDNETSGNAIEKEDFPVVLRPAFAHFLSVIWDYLGNITRFACQFTFGDVVPIVGLIFGVLPHPFLGTMMLTTTAFAFTMDLPVWGAVNYVIPVIATGYDYLSSMFTGKWSKEWMMM